jgi:hypothetical protein
VIYSQGPAAPTWTVPICDSLGVRDVVAKVRISSTGLDVVFVACCAIAMMQANRGW